MAFVKLPVEVQLNIIDRLTTFDKAILRSTCKQFRQLISKQRFHHGHYKYLKDAEQEAWVKEKGLLACIGCNSLRHTSKFADSMLGEKTGQETPVGEIPARVCLRCGISDGFIYDMYFKGDVVKVDDVDFVIVRCLECLHDGLGQKDDLVCTRCFNCEDRLTENSVWSRRT